MMTLDQKPFFDFVTEVKEKIRQAQYEALKAVNRELISLYWDLGALIVKKQQSYGWGKSVVEQLAKELAKEFPGTKGFSVQNLWYMRQFFLEYSKEPNLQPLVGEISWAKHIAIFSKCKDPQQR